MNRTATTSRAPRGARFNFRAIGERLRAYRLAAELRSEDVAERLDISRAAIYKLERGEIVKIDTLERLAALLGVSLANLLGVEVEYHDSAVSYFERMRQLEGRSERIVAHFDPISFLLTSSDYDVWLRHMLEESIPRVCPTSTGQRRSIVCWAFCKSARRVFRAIVWPSQA